MSNILIVSDSPMANSVFEAAFRNFHCSINIIGILAMIGYASYLARQYQFVILVVDADFRKRFGSVITELTATIQNYSKQTSIYLVFENHYDPVFSTWMEHTKRSFVSASNQDNLTGTINEIIRQESLRLKV